MELVVIMTRQNFGFPVFAGSHSCSRCCVRARAEVDTSAGRLSEAKTQRRPERERVRGEGGFPLLFCCFCIFLSSRARKIHVEEKIEKWRDASSSFRSIV